MFEKLLEKKEQRKNVEKQKIIILKEFENDS